MDTIIRKALSVSITEIAGWLLIAGILAGVTAGSHQQDAVMTHQQAQAIIAQRQAAAQTAADRDFDAMDASDAMDNK